MDTLEQRLKNFADAIDLKEPDKVPVSMEVTGWPLNYAGWTLAEAINDPINGAKAYCKFMDDIPYDCHILDFGYMSYPEIYKELGNNEFVMAADGVGIQHAQSNISFFPDEDYEEVITDYINYTKEKRVRQQYSIYSLPKEEAYEHLKRAAILFRQLNDFSMGCNRILTEHGKFAAIAVGRMAAGYGSALNTLFDHLRGMKNTLIDLRRRPEQLDRLCDVITRLNDRPFDMSMMDGLPFKMGTTVYHSECFLSNKQFEKYFLNGFKEKWMPYMEQGLKFFLKGEGSFMNTLHYYDDFPKGSMVIMLEQDDPFEVYKIIGGKHTLIAGIPVEMLQNSTPQECVDYAKRCFDTFAPGGGFIFGNNKPMLCARDAKEENVRAVYEFADEYSRKK